MSDTPLTENELKEYLKTHWRDSIRLDPEKGCWEWLGSLNSAGYSSTAIRKLAPGESMGHRVSYIVVYGKPPKGMVLDHLCEVKHCINPEHLEAVTQKENLRRGRNREKARLWDELTPNVDKPFSWDYYCSNLHVLSDSKYLFPGEHTQCYPSTECLQCRRNKLLVEYSKRPNYTGATRKPSKRTAPERVSGHVGICWDKAMGKWKISLWHERKYCHGGYFINLEEAVEELPRYKLRIGKE